MKRKRTKHKALIEFLRSRQGALKTLQPLTENRRTFGWLCHNPTTSNRCLFINKRSSLNGIVSVGERVIQMSEKQNIPIVLGLDGHYYRMYGKDIIAGGGFMNNHNGTPMFNFSLYKAKAWDVTTIGKFFALVPDENQLSIDDTAVQQAAEILSKSELLEESHDESEEFETAN